MQDYIPRKMDINGNIEPIVVKQYDNLSRYIHLQLFDEDASEDFSEDGEPIPMNLVGCEARLYVELTDGSPTYIDGEVADGEEGIVTFLLPSGMTQTAGDYRAEAVIIHPETGSVISTNFFTIKVKASVHNDSAIEATEKFSALENALIRVAVDRARLNHLEAMVDTGHILPGTVDSEVVDIRTGYNGNTYDSAGNAVRAQISDIYTNRRAATNAEIAAAMDEDYDENEEIAAVLNDLQRVLGNAETLQFQIDQVGRQIDNIGAYLPNSVEIKEIFVTPEMFGAVGDGIADDTIPLQEAINDGRAVVGKGNYKITSSIFINNEYKAQANSKIILDFNGDFGVVIGGSETEYDNTQYNFDVDIIIDCNNNTFSTACVALNAIKRSNIKLRGINCAGTFYKDVYGNNGSNYENYVDINAIGTNQSGSVCARIQATDNNYNQIISRDFETCILLNTHSTQNINCIHAWLSTDTLWENSKVVAVSDADTETTDPIIPRLKFNFLYQDTMRYGFYVNKIEAFGGFWFSAINSGVVGAEVRTQYPLVNFFGKSVDTPSFMRCDFHEFWNNRFITNDDRCVILQGEINPTRSGYRYADANNIPMGNVTVGLANHANNAPVDIDGEITIIQNAGLRYITQIAILPSNLMYVRKKGTWETAWGAWAEIGNPVGRQIDNIGAYLPNGVIDTNKLTPALRVPSSSLSFGTIAEMLKCAETYFNIAYGTANGEYGNLLYKTGVGMYSESLGNDTVIKDANGHEIKIRDDNGNEITDEIAKGKYGIVCSSFVESVINGITYENSRYTGKEKNIQQPWGVVFDDTVSFGRTENPSTTEIKNRYLTSHALAKYADEHGWLYPIDSAHKVKPGDVVFSGNSTDPLRFHGIEHVAIAINVSDDYLTVIEAWNDAAEQTHSKVNMNGTTRYCGVRIKRWSFETRSGEGDNVVVNKVWTYGATFPVGGVYNAPMLCYHSHNISGTIVLTAETIAANGNNPNNVFTSIYSSGPLEPGFYTFVCRGTFPSKTSNATGKTFPNAKVVVTYDKGHPQEYLLQAGDVYYETFYVQQAGTASIAIQGTNQTYNLSDIALYKGYADVSTFSVVSKDSVGMELSATDDLDNCFEGVYYCNNATTATSVGHTPRGDSVNVTSGFRMESVRLSRNNRFMQTLTYIEQPEKVYVRQYTATGWTGWFVYSGTAVPGAETPPEAETPPVAPASITATAGSGSIAVTWAESSGAAYYTLERKAGSGAWSAIAQNYTGRSYTDNSVTAGTSYQYRVTAHKTGTSGVLSSSPTTSSTVTAAGTPSGNVTLDAPASVTATAGSGQISVTWGAVSGASRYQLERSADNGATWTTLLLYQTANSYTDTTVTSGTSYKYRVTAFSSSGDTSPAAVSSSATPQAAPAAVIGGNAILSSETAATVVGNITVGWNLGNTLDCCNDPVQLRTGNKNRVFGAGVRSIGSENEGKAYETSWGDAPITTQEMLEAVVNAGFNAIRIPVTWNHHLRDAALPYDWGLDVIDSGRYTTDIPIYPNLSGTVVISPFFLKRVKEVVNMALNAGFKYVILNTHHDASAYNGASSRTINYPLQVTGLPWLTDIPYQLFHCSNRLGPRFENVSGMTAEKDFQNMCDYMYQLWTMIATEFKDYDYRLIFEGFNEMLNWARAWDQTYHAGNNNEVTTTQHQRFNAFNNTFIKAVRNAGGEYNQNRVLSCQTFGATTADFIVNGFSLSNVPDDGTFTDSNYRLTDSEIAAENSRIILQVHYYNDSSSEFKNAAQRSKAAGFPVIFGEVGWHLDSGAPSDLETFGREIVEKAKSEGAKIFWWDNNKTGTEKDCYGMLNRWNTKNGIPAWDKEALKNGLIAGANAT